ncbi:MAG TPA: S8 family serine peptidase [Gemmata sp.]|nr:S8 family serine peptidase [Gemmata sp.]
MRHLLPSLLLAAVAPLGLAGAQPPRPPAAARVMNPDDARRRLGLLPDYAAVPGIKDVKVAVLDSGFDGVDGKRPYLPAGAVVVEHYDADFVKKFGLGDPKFTRPFTPGNSHGRLLAQLVWATTGSSPDGPRFYLLNANGPTMFRRAVRMAIELKADVILFGGMFEGAGNYDGRGPINAAVDEAVAAGIIWVNAAGNTGGAVYNGPVDVGPDGFLRFGAARAAALRFRNRLDENAATLTLTWNDYRDAEDAGTEKDLDLVVEDSRGQVVGESKLVQVGPEKAVGEGLTKNPRERLILTDLAATDVGSEYRVRIRANTPNFGPRDRVRLLLTPGRPPVPDPAAGKPASSVEFLDATRGGEIYPPADHAGVLTVGDLAPSSSAGPTADGRVKPDVIISDSSARFSNGEETAGASNAAAYFAGVVAVLRAAEPGLTAGHVREWVRALDRESAGAAPAARDAARRPPPIPVRPLSPNEARALRYSGYALDEKLRRGDPDPRVIISAPGGSYVVTPGGRAGADPLPAARVASPPVAGRPTHPPHAAWRTPSPRQLTGLIRGTP